MVGKLLFVSDLEGCAPTGPSGVQSRLLCGEDFFTALRAFLMNGENQVAFLGDYFDKGDMVVESINRIMNLYNEFDTQVRIILGNRDINKLRLIYEPPGISTPDAAGVPTQRWGEWTPFYAGISAPVPLSINDRLKLILQRSMGSTPVPPMFPGANNAGHEEDQAYVLVRAFSAPAAARLGNPRAAALDASFADFFNNIRQLFTVGKIVSHNKDFGSLLSHAGGVEPFLFHDETYYTNIETGLSGVEHYYDKIDFVRRALMEPPTYAAFNETVYNTPLSIIPSLFDSIAPPPTFFLLQGLGLKPNPGRHFTSFVQSCDVQGCKGPYSDDIVPRLDPPIQYKQFLEMLESIPIRFIVHGHVPHCAPIPLIYKRAESSILFIANDTSNGYRPGGIGRVDQIPLAYITSSSRAGVSSLPDFPLRGFPNTYSGGFDAMIDEWDIDTAPTFMTDAPVPRIQYFNKGRKTRYLKFEARRETTMPAIFKAAVMVGGRRARSKRISKKKVKRSMKKTKKSKK